MADDKQPSTDGGFSGTECAAFERIDWDEVDHSSPLLTAERVTLAVGLLVVLLANLYFREYRQTYLVFKWAVGYEDWLLMVSVVLLTSYGLVPLLKRPESLKRTVSRLRHHTPTLLSLVVLTLLVGLSLWSIVLSFEPSLGSASSGWTVHKFQPPVGTTVDFDSVNFECVGKVTGGDSIYSENRRCHGSMQYPGGTDRWGYGLGELLFAGAQPFAYLAVITLGLIVPLATLVGMAAGYYGGRIDDLLMSYVDMQLSIPAIVLYMISYMYFQNSMFMLVVAFGLLSWGGIARIVRSETLQRTEEGYVLSARAIGVSDRTILREHLFPNITNTVVPATFHLIAILVLTEAGLAFIGFHPSFQSWGMTTVEGLFYGGTRVWWNSVFPAVAVTLTVLSLKIAGDGFRDVLDPRGER